MLKIFKSKKESWEHKKFIEMQKSMEQLPEDEPECKWCGEPLEFVGIFCNDCEREYERLLKKLKKG